jgi:HK97 family phage prohead protease
MTEPLLLVRSFATMLERTDRRTLEGIFVPWDVPADVADIEIDRNGDRVLTRYREGFRLGAFDKQVLSPEPGVVRRIALRDQHHGGLGKLGTVVAMRNEPIGLHGTVNVLPSRVDDLEALLDDGVDGLSAEFHPLARPSLTPDGTVWRTKAHLVGVALEASPAYADARVLAMRAAAEVADEEAAERAAHDAELAALDAYLTEQRERQQRYAIVDG